MQTCQIQLNSTAPNMVKQRGVTLIGLLGALAVLAILAAVLIPSAIRKLDLIAGAKETATLKSMAEAFQRSILRTQTIPSHANWAQAVAAELGVNPTDVTTNLRRQPRVLLIDPEFLVGTNTYTYGDAYVQNNFGSVLFGANGRVIPPINPRMVIVSSIGTPLPAAIVNWTPESAWTAADFNGIWEWNDAGNGLPTGGAWAGWNGARDLHVQRVNLAPLFARVVLSTYTSDADGLFSLNGGTTLTDAPTDVLGRNGYYFQNSPLQLYTHLGELDTQHILTRDISFVYQQNIWRSSMEGLGFPGGMDIGTVVDRFLKATGNPESQAGKDGLDPKVQQQRVVQAFKEFMQAYLAWEETGFTDNSLRDLAQDNQKAMMNRVQELYKNPTYTPPEIPCP
jgi:type II secretory pathway pseudopilin PulG